MESCQVLQTDESSRFLGGCQTKSACAGGSARLDDLRRRMDRRGQKGVGRLQGFRLVPNLLWVLQVSAKSDEKHLTHGSA